MVRPGATPHPGAHLATRVAATQGVVHTTRECHDTRADPRALAARAGTDGGRPPQAAERVSDRTVLERAHSQLPSIILDLPKPLTEALR